MLEKFTPYPHIKICTDLSQFQRLQTSLAKSSHSACYVLLKLSGEYLSLFQLSIEGNLSPKGALHFINIYLWSSESCSFNTIDIGFLLTLVSTLPVRCNIESVQSTLPWQFFKFLKMLVTLSLVPSRLEASSPHWSVHFPLDTLICQWLSQTPRADVQPRTQYNLLAMVHWYCARFPLCLGYKISTYMSLEWIRFLKLYSTSKYDTYIENCTVQKNAVQGAITKQASTLLPPKSRAITAHTCFIPGTSPSFSTK